MTRRTDKTEQPDVFSTLRCADCAAGPLGSVGLEHETSFSGEHHRIRCKICGRHTAWRDTRDAAIEAWQAGNILPPLFPTQAQPAAVKAAPVIQDSGERTTFTTGAVRDMHEGKGRFDLLPMCALMRLARHYENGCKKYGDRNWEKGIPAHSFADSALRHMMKYMDGWDDEDHLIAAVWNLLGLAWTEEKHPELMDIPSRAQCGVKSAEKPCGDS